MLLHVCPFQWLHLGEQYNPTFGHLHVFRQHVLQPHDTIRNTRVGDTGRSVVSGTKLSPLYCQTQSVRHTLFQFHCCPFSLVLHTRCCQMRKHAVALSMTMVRSSGEQGSSSSWQQRISMTVHMYVHIWRGSIYKHREQIGVSTDDKDWLPFCLC